MTAQAISLGVSLFAIVWFWRRANLEFRRGYLLALDHVEGMTKDAQRIGERPTEERDEMSPPSKGGGGT